MLISFPSIPLAAVLRKDQGTQRKQEAVGGEIKDSGHILKVQPRSREVGDDCRILGDRTGTVMRMSGTDCRPGSLCCHGQ